MTSGPTEAFIGLLAGFLPVAAPGLSSGESKLSITTDFSVCTNKTSVYLIQWPPGLQRLSQVCWQVFSLSQPQVCPPGNLNCLLLLTSLSVPVKHQFTLFSDLRACRGLSLLAFIGLLAGFLPVSAPGLSSGESKPPTATDFSILPSIFTNCLWCLQSTKLTMFAWKYRTCFQSHSIYTLKFSST